MSGSASARRWDSSARLTFRSSCVASGPGNASWPRSDLEQRMRLKVKADKSGVRQPSDVHFLGFRFQCRTTEGVCETAVLLSAKAERRLKATIRAGDTSKLRGVRSPPVWMNSAAI